MPPFTMPYVSIWVLASLNFYFYFLLQFKFETSYLSSYLWFKIWQLTNQQKGTWSLCPYAHFYLRHPDYGFTSPFSTLCCQSCSGVREGSHFPTWKTLVWRSKRSWSLLYHSLCGYLWKDWHEDSNFWCPTTGGKSFYQLWQMIQYGT